MNHRHRFPDHLPPARCRADFRPRFSELEPRLLLATGVFAQPSPTDLANAIPIVLGDPVSGDFSMIQSAVYRFDVTEPEFVPYGEEVTGSTRVVSRVDAPGSEISLSLFDVTGRRLLESDGVSSSDRNGQITLTLDPGTYYFALQRSGVGPETFALETSAIPVITRFGAVFSQDFAPNSQFATGDFNGDGHLDFVSPAGAYYGQGDGSFLHATGSPEASALVVADFDGDKNSEIAFATNVISISTIAPSETSSSLNLTIDPGNDDHPGDRQGFRFRDLTTGDFNGDGIPDLAATAPYENRVLVVLGLGGGQFATPTWLSTPAFPYALTAADLNGDGRDDLIVTHPTGDEISVFPSLGSGQFAAPEELGVGHGPIAVKAVDLNGDHRPELVVTDVGSSQIAILANQGNLIFGAPTLLMVGDLPITLQTGDFNGDGIPDLVTSSAEGTVSNLDPTFSRFDQGNASRDITVLLGHGDGRTFDVSRASNFPASSGLGPGSIFPGDFDGDGRLDLLAGTYGGSVLFGRGDGTFRSVSHVRVGSVTTQVLSGDFNNDGRPDLISVGAGSNDISVNLGEGDGNLGNPIRTPVAFVPYRMVLGDFNQDGRLDFAVACLGFSEAGIGSAPGTLTIGLGRGDGSFLTRDIPLLDGGIPYSLATGDFNGDGRLDLAATDIGGQIGYPDILFVVFGLSDGTFSPITAQAGLGLGGTMPTGLVSADLNHDGRDDLLVLTSNSYVVLLSRVDGTFDPNPDPVSADGYLGFTPRLVDVNGGGVLDFIADLLPSDQRGLIAVGIGRGDGTFGPLSFYGGTGDQYGGDRSIGEGGAVGDFDGDGHPDFIVGLFNINGNTTILHNQGDGTFEPIPGPTFDRNSVPGGLAAVDLNGDGRTDIVAATYGSDDLPTFLNLGNNQFYDPFNGSAAIDNIPILADLNGDGTPDLTALNGAGAILWRRGDPKRPGHFDSPVILNPGTPARGIVVVATPAGPRLAAAALDAGLVRLYARSGGDS